MKQQKQKYTNSNKDPTGATELVYYGLKCDTKPLDLKAIRFLMAKPRP